MADFESPRNPTLRRSSRARAGRYFFRAQGSVAEVALPALLKHEQRKRSPRLLLPDERSRLRLLG
jgi:hypothetical protein